MDDAELIRAAQNGDVLGLGFLLERHQASLYAIALRILGRGPEAQDAVQTIFLIAWATSDGCASPKRWAGGCAASCATSASAA